VTEFADRVNRLVRRWEQVHRTRLGNHGLAVRLAAAGYPVTGQYISQLRHGHRAHPSVALIGALTRVFDVDPGYFDHGDPGPVPADAEVVAALDDPGLRRLACAAAGLSPPDLQLLIVFAEKFRIADGLGPGPAADL
jgi:transcriptional regulator with XRE-family HTH domain